MPVRLQRAIARVAVVTTLVVPASALAVTPAGAVAETCVQDWRPAASAVSLGRDGQVLVPAPSLPPRPSPEHRAAHVFCGPHYVNTVWVPPHLTTIEAVRLSRDIVARAAYPSVRPAVNPVVGVTGMATWFWAATDATPVRMLPGNGPGIELELRVQTVRWRFGDGTTGSVTGLGAPFPSPSPVRHVFERKGRFTVEAQVVVAGRMWFEELIVDLPTGGHTVALDHDVAEIRSLLHAR